MANITINTTQNVNINFTLADQSQRITAHLIDVAIKGVYIFSIFMFLIQSETFNGMDMWSQNAFYVVCALPVTFYSLLMEYFNEGQTLGKKLLKTKVVKIDGYQADFLDIFTRWCMRIIDIQFGGGIIGIISISRSSKHQRLGDIAAGTSVISIRNTVEFNQTIFEEIDQNYTPKYPQVTLLSDNDIRIIKNNLIVARRQQDTALISQLKEKVENTMGIKASEDDYVFIDRVIKDYNYYTQSEVSN